MDRGEWLAGRRAAVERNYSLEAPSYDEGYDPATPEHLRFVALLLDTTPSAGLILDAACGTGPYIGLTLAAGRRVVGTDQSEGMLTQARSNHPKVRFDQIGLQELAFEEDFDAAMCVDAMENVPPEEWLGVLDNLRRAVRPSGFVYLTVEEIERQHLNAAFEEAIAAGSPSVYGEVVAGETAGYHHYPDRDQVQRWLTDAGFRVIQDADEWLDGYGYHHLLVQASD